MKIFNKNLLLEVKKSGEEGPFTQAEKELKEDRGYTCRFDPGDEAYYCTPPKSKKKDNEKNKENQNTNNTDTHPKNQSEGDEFRKWMKDTYPDFKCGQDTLSPDPGKPFNNNCIKQAWKEYKQQFRDYKKSNGTTTQTQDTKDYEKRIKNLENNFNEQIKIHCAEWKQDNWFEIDFQGNEDKKAKEFAEFCEKDPRVPSSIYDNSIGSFNLCQKSFEDYKRENNAHLSPFIKKISMTRMSKGTGFNMPNQQSRVFAYDAWKSTLKKNESKIIRKKLLELKEMKTIKESIRKKLSSKTEKIDVISENLYKVAGKFYNENYNEFFKKFEKLTENYKKSKLFLKEDSSESFNRALNKVFKGDEEKLKKEAIPFFMNKLGLEGAIRTQVENELDKKYGADNVGDMFLDCWADIVVQSFKDNAKSEITEPSNVMDAIEKIMVSKIDSSEFDYQLKKEICKMLKPAQEKRQTKVQDLAKKLAQSIIDSSEA